MMLASANHQIQTVSITEHRHVCSLLFFSQVLSIIKGKKGKKKGVIFFTHTFLKKVFPETLVCVIVVLSVNVLSVWSTLKDERVGGGKEEESHELVCVG